MNRFLFICIILSTVAITANAQNLKSFTAVNSDIPGNDVKAVCVDNFNNTWFGTNAGLAFLKDTTWIVYNSASSPAIANNQVNDIEMEVTSNPDSVILWIATEVGITMAVIDSNGIQSSESFYAGISGNPLTNDQISSVAISSTNGKKYFGTLHGLGILENDTWVLLDTSSTPEIANFPITAVDANVDTVYVGLNGDDEAYCPPVIYRIFSDVDGYSYATTSPDEFYTYPFNVLSTNVISVFIDSDGHRWFGTDKGITVHISVGGKSDNYIFNATMGLAGDTVLCINQDPDGVMWFGTTRGVSKMEVLGTFENIVASDGLASDTVYDIDFGIEGNYWFATNKGVSELDGTDWNQFYNGLNKMHANAFNLTVSPNPALNFVTINCDFPGEDIINISIYNQSGQLIKQLVSGYHISGMFEVTWNLTTSDNVAVPSGLYAVRVEGNQGFSVQKLIVVK